MTLAQASQKRFANAHQQHALKYAVNDLVWLDAHNLMTQWFSKKLFDKFEKLFRIIKIISSHAYQLKLLN